MSARRVSRPQPEQNANAGFGDYNLDPIVQFNNLHASNQTFALSSNSHSQSALDPQAFDENRPGAAFQHVSSVYLPIDEHHGLSQNSRAYAQQRPNEWAFVDPAVLTSLDCQRSIPERPSGSTSNLSTLNTIAPAWSPSGPSIRRGHAHHRSISSGTSSSSSFTQPRTPYTCSMCDRPFAYPKDLRRHAITHLSNPERPFLCPIDRCPYSIRGFSRRDVLIRHARAVHSMQSIPNH